MSDFRFGIRKLPVRKRVDVKLKSLFGLTPMKKQTMPSCGKFFLSPVSAQLSDYGWYVPGIVIGESKISGTPCGLLQNPVDDLHQTVIPPDVPGYSVWFGYNGTVGDVPPSYMFIGFNDPMYCDIYIGFIIGETGIQILMWNWYWWRLPETVLFNFCFRDEAGNEAILHLTITFQSAYPPPPQ